MTLRDERIDPALAAAVQLGVGRALLDIASLRPGLRVERTPDVVAIPQTFNRLPLHQGVCTIDLQAGTVTWKNDGDVVATFQAPPKFVARSFFIVADDHLQLQGDGPHGRWGPFQTQQCTPHVFDNLEIVTLDLTWPFSVDVQVVFGSDVTPPVEIKGFGLFPMLRYGTQTTGAPGDWNSIFMGAANGTLANALTDIDDISTVLSVQNIGRRRLVVRNTGANAANVRVQGRVITGLSFVNDDLDGTLATPANGFPIAAGDFASVQWRGPWNQMQLQAQTPAGGTATTLQIELIGLPGQA